MAKKDYSVEEKLDLIKEMADFLGEVGEVFDVFRLEAIPYQMFVEILEDEDVKDDLTFKKIVDLVIEKVGEDDKLCEDINVLGGLGGLIRIMSGQVKQKRDHLARIKEIYDSYSKEEAINQGELNEDKEKEIADITAEIKIYFNKK